MASATNIRLKAPSFKYCEARGSGSKTALENRLILKAQEDVDNEYQNAAFTERIVNFLGHERLLAA